MKKKWLAVFFVCIGLCLSACGTNESEMDQNSLGRENDSDYETEINANEEDYTEDVSEAETDYDMEDADDQGAETDYDMEDTDAQETEQTTGEEEHISSEPSGLIILDDTTDADAFRIVSIQPESGEQQEIASFVVAGINQEEEFFYQVLTDPFVLSDSMKQKISYDYTKLAATKFFRNDMESHAGWLENDGTFLDVTEKLGLQSKSDFDDPVYYKAIGFTEDGYFMFCDSDHDYYVPLDNLSSGFVEEGSPFPHEDTLDDFFRNNLNYFGRALLTDWVNDHVFLYQNEKYMCRFVSGSVHSYIGDLETGEMTEYIPGSKDTWNGVVSPDGKTIAFMSNASGDTAIYFIPVAGGEPVELRTDMEFSNPWRVDEGFCAMLIDWR